jgi:hypothetical protein
MHTIPDPFKSLRLEAWLAKTPSERFLQFLLINDAYFKAVEQEMKTIKKISAKIKDQHRTT